MVATTVGSKPLSDQVGPLAGKHAVARVLGMGVIFPWPLGRGDLCGSEAEMGMLLAG